MKIQPEEKTLEEQDCQNKLLEIPGVMPVRTAGKSMHSGLKPIGYMFHMFLSILGILIRQNKEKNEPKAVEKNNV